MDYFNNKDLKPDNSNNIENNHKHNNNNPNSFKYENSNSRYEKNSNKNTRYRYSKKSRKNYKPKRSTNYKNREPIKSSSFFNKYSIHIISIIIILVIVITMIIIFTTCGKNNSKTNKTIPTETTAKNIDDNLVVITITGSNIMCNGEEIDSFNDLKSKLQISLTSTTAVSLIDDNADLEVYQEVNNILTELGFPSNN